MRHIRDTYKALSPINKEFLIVKEIIRRKLSLRKPRFFGAFSYVKIRILGNARRIIEIQNRLILFGYILEKYYG